MTDKEAFFVVIAINEPTGNAISPTGLDFSRFGMEDIYAMNFDL
jgi:hypothetical protein